MATWSEVKQWKPDAIGQLGDHLAAQNNLVVGLQDELDRGHPAEWTGDAADAAGNDLRARRQELEDLAARLSAVVKIIDDTEQAVRDLVRDIGATEEHAARNGYRIDNGEVVEINDAGGFFSGMTLHIEVQTILARAAEIDAELTSVLRRVLSGEINDAGATTLTAAAEAGEDRIADEQRHRDLLARYQVRTDGTKG